MAVKEYLDQHKLLCDRIQKDEESLTFLCPAVSDPHAPHLVPDHVHVSPAGDAPFVANLEYIAGVKEKLASEKAVLRRLTDEIQLMFSVLDPYMQMAQRYLYHMPWDDIIGSTKSCRATVFNWHKKPYRCAPSRITRSISLMNSPGSKKHHKKPMPSDRIIQCSVPFSPTLHHFLISLSRSFPMLLNRFLLCSRTDESQIKQIPEACL